MDTDSIAAVLWGLQPANALVCEVALVTGWRIDDILALETEAVHRALELKRPCITITEQKTGKKSKRYIDRGLLLRVYAQAGQRYVFEGRDDYRRHRTRQAVFMDLKKTAKKFKVKLNFAPHSLRKNYAVYLREHGKTIEEIQKIMNHADMATTLLYAMSDELTKKHRK